MPRQRVHNITDAPARRPRVVKSTAETTSTTQSGGDQPKVTTSRGEFRTRQSRNTRLSNYNPAKVGSDSASGVGALEAEFLASIALLILLMFANNSSGYTDRIMSFMKRGTLVCVMFFILALVSTAGPTASKVAKAFGALVVISILLTSPVTTVMTDLDNLIKNDWTGTNPLGGGTSPSSADSGTSGSTTNPGPLTKAQQDLKTALQNSNNQLKQITGLNQQQLGIVGQIQQFLSGLIP